MKKSGKLLYLPVICCIGAYLLVFGIINFFGFAKLATSDMYVDTLAAKLIWEQKTLFPYGFTFGNQIYAAATPVLAALFHGLTESSNTAMALATTVMGLLILLSFYWAVCPWLSHRLYGFCGALLLLAAVFGPEVVRHFEGQLFFTMCSYYACYTIVLFIVFGDYARALESSKPRAISLGLCLLLCFAMGMQSLRQTCVMILPLICFQLLLLLRQRIVKGSFCLRENFTPLIRIALYTAFNLDGVMVSKALDIRQHTIFDTPSPTLIQRLIDALQAVFRLTGANAARTGEVFFIIFFLLQIALLLAALVLELKKLRAEPRGLSVLWWLLAISIGAVLAASFLTELRIRSIYMFTYYLLLAVSLVIVLEEAKAFSGAIVLLLCALSLGNIYFSYWPSLEQALDKPKDPAADIAQWAVNEGYELVYGNFSFSAPIVALYSDGKLTAGSWDDEIMFKALPYLNLQNIYSEEDVHRAIFVFMPWEMDYAHEAAESIGAELKPVYTAGSLTAYASDIQLMYPRTYPWTEW